MATFFECPPIVAPTNDTVTVSNNTQLQNAIQARANGGGNENILINGTVNNIFVDGIDDIHFWFLAGSSLQDNGSQAGAAGIRFRNSDNFGVHGINPGGVPGTNVARPDIDGNSTGNNGAIWGIVVGNSFLGDPLGGACTNGVIEGVDVHHPQQEGIKVAQTGTRDIEILCNEIRDTGQEQLVHLGEGIYIGQGAGGNGGTEFLTGIRVQGNWLHEIFSGEAVDVKRGSEAIVVDNRIERVTLPFGGAITFWSDNLAAGGTGNSLIARNRINDITPSPDAFTQTSDAIQIGDEVLVENNVVWDYTGFGLSMVRQFAGPGDTIRVRHNTFDSSSGVAALGVNQDAPNGGNNFGTMNSCGNLYVGDHTVGFNFNGSTFQDTQYQSGFVGSGSDGSQYALVTSSPHVDAAPSCGTGNDICFVSRPQNGTADFGAFEFIETVEVELADDVITGVVGTPLFSNVFANDPSMGIAPTTCMVVTGATPAGIVFDSVTGTLSGTPTAAGPSRLVYQCVDSNGSADTATVTFTIVGLNNPVVLADDNFTGAIGVPALFDLTANDPNLGDPTTICLPISGTLPPGMFFDSFGGNINGTPTTAGTYTFIYRCTDDDGDTDTATVTVVIDDPNDEPVVLADDNFTGTVGSNELFDLFANDPNLGNSPTSCQIINGTLPPGMFFDGFGGNINGAPTTAGTYALTYRCTDDDGDTDTATVNIVINPDPNDDPVILNDGMWSGTIGTFESFNIFDNDLNLGDAPTTCVITSGSPPPGMTFRPTTGAVNGTPTAVGTYTFTYVCTDANGDSDSATETFIISEVDEPVILADDIHFTDIGTPVTVNIFDNDPNRGNSPTACSMLPGGEIPPGMTLSLRSSGPGPNGELAGTPTTAGTYIFEIQCVDSDGDIDVQTITCVVTDPNPICPDPTIHDVCTEFCPDPDLVDGCRDVVIQFNIAPLEPNKTSCCDTTPKVIDQYGNAYNVGFDADGNSAIVIPDPNPAKPAVLYESNANMTPSGACCLTVYDIGRPAYDISGQCVTHICMGPDLGWQPLCTGGAVVTPFPPAEGDDAELVCYDVAAMLPATYGGANSAWVVQAGDALESVQCIAGDTVATPLTTDWTCDFVAFSTPDNAANIAGYSLNNVPGNNVGSSTGAICPGGVNRPTFVQDFGSLVGSGPFSAQFEITSGNGNILFAPFNTCTNQYLSVANISAPPGASYFIDSTAGGDVINIDSAIAASVGTYVIDLVDSNVDPSCVQFVWFGVNGFTVAGSGEEIANVGLAYTADGTGFCCFTAGSAAEMAELLTDNDPAGNTWTADGDLVCAVVPIGQGQIYGDLTVCTGVSSPVVSAVTV